MLSLTNYNKITSLFTDFLWGSLHSGSMIWDKGRNNQSCNFCVPYKFGFYRRSHRLWMYPHPNQCSPIWIFYFWRNLSRAKQRKIIKYTHWWCGVDEKCIIKIYFKAFNRNHHIQYKRFLVWKKFRKFLINIMSNQAIER